MSGTATGGDAYYNLFDNSNGFPNGIIPGETYFAKVSGHVDIMMQVYSYNPSLTRITNVYPSDGKIEITIPSTATGMRARLTVVSGKTINADILPEIRATSTLHEITPIVTRSESNIIDNEIFSVREYLHDIVQGLSEATTNGVTFTPNKDGTITTSGTTGSSYATYHIFN